MSELTELEGAVLSLIARFQPMTAYAVRSAFRKSLTNGWSASAGSVYPLVGKLIQIEYINEVLQKSDGRGTKMLNVTRTGKMALRKWATATESNMGSAVVDPIRTRCFILDSLPLPQQKRLVADWKRITEDVVCRTKVAIEASQKVNDKTETRALSGSLLQLEARLQWLREITFDEFRCEFR